MSMGSGELTAQLFRTGELSVPRVILIYMNIAVSLLHFAALSQSVFFFVIWV